MRRSKDERPGPLSLVYIAGNVVEAQKVERALTERGIEYEVNLEPFMKSSAVAAVFGGTYAGAFFRVPSSQHSLCRDLLHAQGLRDTVSLDESVMQGEG